MTESMKENPEDLDLYSADTTIAILIRTNASTPACVLAGSAQEASKIIVQDALAILKDSLGMDIICNAFGKSHQINVTTKVHTHSVSKVYPQEKGQKRSPLTKVQRRTLKSMILGSPNPYGGRIYCKVNTKWHAQWYIVGKDILHTVTPHTIAALLRRNLIKPEMTTFERKVQQALGTVDPEIKYSYVLNLDEAQKRGIYKELPWISRTTL